MNQYSIRLPLPHKLTLTDFSLYQNRKRIEVDFNDGVLCLAGANGLGKSTFLMTLNYAITGVAADPDRKFDSLDEYYRYSSPYARNYYNGRIGDKDREIASVRLKMSVGDNKYELERGFFEQESLRFLQITGPSGVVFAHDETQSDADRNEAYRQHVLADSGLAEFEQLVFLQHFVLTFDERRRLLLWDAQTIEQTLMLAFGVSPIKAKQADDWRRKAERAESQARNLQYQAKTARDRVADLLSRAEPIEAPSEDEDEIYVKLLREIEALQSQLARARNDESMTLLEQAEVQAHLVEVDQEYDDAFSALLRPHPGSHPVVLETLASDVCQICASRSAGRKVRHELDAGCCPLCGNSFEPLDERHAARLGQLDDRVSEVRQQAASVANRLEGLQQDRRDLEERLLAYEADPAQPGNATSDIRAPFQEHALDALVQQYEQEATDATRRRDAWRVKRDEYKELLAPVATELAQRYVAAEDQFVPRFTTLAHRFLGLDMEVYLQQRGGRPSLVVVVEGSERRSYDQLSESQRYFLDIALRMALVQHIGQGQNPGCLYIDTPEGSLDISYEARAGDMFSDFVEAGDRLIMTANINTSRLLLEMAARCGSQRMTIVRMMDWTRLSDVQADGEALFDKALTELQEALDGQETIS